MVYPYVSITQLRQLLTFSYICVICPKNFLITLFSPKARTCICFHAEVYIELVWTEEHISGARSSTGGFLIWQLAS